MELPQPVLIVIEQMSSVIFWLACAAWLLYAYYVLFHGGVPNIHTAPAIRAEVIRRLRDDMAARGQPYKVVDLGSANGLLTRDIAAALPEATVTGLELNRLAVWISNRHKKRLGLNNLAYHQQDFFKADLGQYQAIVMFLIPSLLTTMGHKLLAEAPAGTLIICNKFPLGGGWTPDETLQIKTLYLHQGKLFVYRKD
jgi:predicted O-methyltransferase YrrM